jgi:hypothetical protein
MASNPITATVPIPDAPDVAALADVIEVVVKAALGPVMSRLRALETAAIDTANTVASIGARPPIPGPTGPAGADGLGFDDYAIDFDGERTVTHRWARGDARMEHVIKLPTMIYRGVYVGGKVYDRGDCVTWAGSLWHCNVETTTRPGDGSPAWTLAVKRGRDATK